MPARSVRPTTSSDRPLPPRVATELDVVDLATITTGEWDRVELVGDLPQDFDEPLLLTEVRMTGASLVGARLAGSRLVDVIATSCELSGVDLQEASLTRVEVTDCRMSGAPATRGGLPRSAVMTPSARSWRSASRIVCRLTPYADTSASSPGKASSNSCSASRRRRSRSTCAHRGSGLRRSSPCAPAAGSGTPAADVTGTART